MGDEVDMTLRRTSNRKKGVRRDCSNGCGETPTCCRAVELDAKAAGPYPWATRVQDERMHDVSQSNGRPRALVIRSAGTNCDIETAYALDKAGARAERVHVNRLVEAPEGLDGFQVLVIPGGFSYGDDIASARILANELRFALGDALRRFVGRGNLVLGICNGFQALVKAGLLGVDAAGKPQATLSFNDSGKFEDRWVYLKASTDRCVFVRPGEDAYLPVAHGEGKFLVSSPAALERMEREGLVVFRYVGPDGRPGSGYPWNPNGSVADVAGICDPSGRIFGLMPHPERHVDGTQHPRWTREGLKPEGDGLRVFRNAVAYARANLL